MRWFLAWMPVCIFGLDDAAVGLLGGSLISGLFGASGASKANETNIQLGREQMNFQERMSNTAYERATESMKRAGLNPMLAYSQGGASAPVGAMPQVQNVAGAGASSAASGAALAGALQSVLQSQAQTEQIGAMTRKVESETLAQDLNTAVAAAHVDSLRSGARSSSAQAAKTVEEIRGSVYDSRRKQEEFEAMVDGGFTADVVRRKAEGESARMQAEKDRITKLPYELLDKARPLFERSGNGLSDWWRQLMYDRSHGGIKLPRR